MGIFDFLGGSGPDKALKLKPKVTQKYGDPSSRQKALQQLGEMKFPEAVTVLMHRYTITVEPLTTDADEKEHVFELIKGFGKDAIAPVSDFLRKSEQATSWSVRILEALQSEAEVVSTVVATLTALSAQYMRDPEKKVVLLHYITGKQDEKIAPVLLPFLDDMSDDVKIAALKALGPLKYAPAREPMQKLTSGDTARRVQVAATQALQESGFSA